jgi:uncharacterized protein YjbJ (UPF0337 family)
MLQGRPSVALDRIMIYEEMLMNWDQITGNWMQFKGKVKEKWGKLTDDDLTTIGGKRDQLVGVLQQKYGYAKSQAEQELDEFARDLRS